MEEEKDVIEVEATTDSSSEENKPEEKTVPFDRFQEVVKEKNQYKELLSTIETTKEAEPEKSKTEYGDDESLKLIDERIKSTVSKELNSVNRKINLDKTIAENPDFYKYHEIIKEKIQDNPNMSYSDAYKLAKFDAIQIEAQEKGKQDAYKKKEEKKAGVVESTVKSRSSESGGEIDPLAKGPDGKFLYSLKELEDVLPKK